MTPRYQPNTGRQPSPTLAEVIIGPPYFWTGLAIAGGNDTEIYLNHLTWNPGGVPNQNNVDTIDKTEANPQWIAREVGGLRVTPTSINVDQFGSLAITWPDVPAPGEPHFIDADAGGFFASMLPGSIPCNAGTL